MRLKLLCGSVFLISALTVKGQSSPPMKINDSEYFEAPGANVLVYSNWYDGLFSDSKISGAVEFC